MKWFGNGRSEQPQHPRGVVPLTGVSKTNDDMPAVPSQLPPPHLLAAGGPIRQRDDGDGDRVVRLTTGAAPVILDITHRGGGHFVVDALDGKLRSGSQLVYTDGPFACRSLINADDRPVRALRVQADAHWTIEVRDISTALPLEANGHAARPASDVLRYEGGPGIATLRYGGAQGSSDGGYFLADTFETDATAFLDELANQLGPWQGEAPLSGPCLIYARSDGPWSISVQSLEG
ncbi:hypothetical protein ACFYXF_09630 [Streptomyces sp. NPDC002680]|uniref:hypothetical protein n=1 Tax=Streptomyces sp. NPDC002680 TaxID=3364659 RepID=UPI0036839F44